MKPKVNLMSSVPCKRFDFSPLCIDGRGGWTFSQYGSDRYVADPSILGVKLGLAIWVSPPVPGDFIQQTELNATMGDEMVGTDLLYWKNPNSGGQHHEDGSVFEWIQDIKTPVKKTGLLSITLRIKLHSQAEFLPVAGNVMLHITCQDTNDKLIKTEQYEEALADESKAYHW